MSRKACCREDIKDMLDDRGRLRAGFEDDCVAREESGYQTVH